MGNGSADVRIDVALSSEEGREFLRRLAEDEEFRASLERSPQQTLGEMGITVSDTVVPDAVALPSAEDAGRALEMAREGDPRSVGRGVFSAVMWILAP